MAGLVLGVVGTLLLFAFGLLSVFSIGIRRSSSIEENNS
jgi:hypothetical protein